MFLFHDFHKLLQRLGATPLNIQFTHRHRICIEDSMQSNRVDSQWVENVWECRCKLAEAVMPFRKGVIALWTALQIRSDVIAKFQKSNGLGNPCAEIYIRSLVNFCHSFVEENSVAKKIGKIKPNFTIEDLILSYFVDCRLQFNML